MVTVARDCQVCGRCIHEGHLADAWKASMRSTEEEGSRDLSSTFSTRMWCEERLLRMARRQRADERGACARRDGQLSAYSSRCSAAIVAIAAAATARHAKRRMMIHTFACTNEFTDNNRSLK